MHATGWMVPAEVLVVDLMVWQWRGASLQLHHTWRSFCTRNCRRNLGSLDSSSLALLGATIYISRLLRYRDKRHQTNAWSILSLGLCGEFGRSLLMVLCLVGWLVVLRYMDVNYTYRHIHQIELALVD